MSEEEIRPGFIRVSDIAGSFAGYGKIPKNILAYAADRSTLIHSLIGKLTNDIPVSADQYIFCDKSIKEYIDSFSRFWETMRDVEIVLQEERLYSDAFMITGKMDLVIDTPDGRTLIDWKCTKEMGKHWSLQATGYDLLIAANSSLREPNIDRILFVNLDKEGGEPRIAELDSDFATFEKALELYMMFFKDWVCILEE